MIGSYILSRDENRAVSLPCAVRAARLARNRQARQEKSLLIQKKATTLLLAHLAVPGEPGA